MTTKLLSHIAIIAFSVLLTDSAFGQWSDRVTTYVSFEELEVGSGSATPILFDFYSWAGGDVNRIIVEVDGSIATRTSESSTEAQLKYSRLVSSFWEVHAGVGIGRHEKFETDGITGAVVLALSGVTPYWIEIEPSLELTTDGDVRFDLEADRSILITQLTSISLSMDIAGSIFDNSLEGNGVSDFKIAARVGREIFREFRPYVGFMWERKVGTAAELWRSVDGSVSSASVVVGFHMWR